MSIPKRPPITGGDDLEDDLVLEPDYLPSDADDNDMPDELMNNGDEEDLPHQVRKAEEEDGDEDDEMSPDDRVDEFVAGQKRKAEDAAHRPTGSEVRNGSSEQLSAEDKKKKRKLKEKARKEKVCFAAFLRV